MNLESVPTVNSGTIAFFNSACMRVQSMYCPTYCCLHRKKLSIHRRLSCCFNYFFLEKSTLLEFFKDFIESHIDKHGSFAMKSIFSERNLSTSCNRAGVLGLANSHAGSSSECETQIFHYR